MNFLRLLIVFLFFGLLLTSERENTEKRLLNITETVYEREPLEGRDFVYYTVQYGDSLSLLQRKFRVPGADAILELNPNLNADSLEVGQKIKIPL